MKQRINQFIILVFAILFISGGFRINAEAKKKTVHRAYVKIDQTAGKVLVTSNGKEIAVTPYVRETVYATTDIPYVRRGPGSDFDTVKKVRKDLGDSMVRIGNINGTWSIIVVKGKYYFINSEYLSTKKPAHKLSANKFTSRQLKWKGVIHWNGWRWTWYSQRVLRGSALNIPGRHVDKKGYVCDKDGYICLASGRLRKGTVVKTPFGKKGKVYDSGCARGTLDVYTNF